MRREDRRFKFYAGTVRRLPRLCAPAATVIWTRHRRPPDLTPFIRDTFAHAGFEEVAFHGDGASPLGVGANRPVASPRREASRVTPSADLLRTAGESTGGPRPASALRPAQNAPVMSRHSSWAGRWGS
jgi:hypothetical protein